MGLAIARSLGRRSIFLSTYYTISAAFQCTRGMPYAIRVVLATDLRDPQKTADSVLGTGHLMIDAGRSVRISTQMLLILCNELPKLKSCSIL